MLTFPVTSLTERGKMTRTVSLKSVNATDVNGLLSQPYEIFLVSSTHPSQYIIRIAQK